MRPATKYKQSEMNGWSAFDKGTLNLKLQVSRSTKHHTSPQIRTALAHRLDVNVGCDFILYWGMSWANPHEPFKDSGKLHGAMVD